MKLKSRKFILSVIIFIITIVLFLANKLSEDGFLQTLMTIYAIYVGGNVTTKFIQRK